MKREERHFDAPLTIARKSLGGGLGQALGFLHLSAHGGGKILVSWKGAKRAGAAKRFRLVAQIGGESRMPRHQRQGVEKPDLIPILRQVLRDHQARREGDLALFRSPAEENADPDLPAHGRGAPSGRIGVG